MMKSWKLFFLRAFDCDRSHRIYFRAELIPDVNNNSSSPHREINFAYEIQFVVTQRRHKCMWFYIVVKYILCALRIVAAFFVLLTFKWIGKYFLQSCLSIMALASFIRKQILLRPEIEIWYFYFFQLRASIFICLLVLCPTFSQCQPRFSPQVLFPTQRLGPDNFVLLWQLQFNEHDFEGSVPYGTRADRKK